MMMVEGWRRGKLLITHELRGDPPNGLILDLYRFGPEWTVKVWPKGHPEKIRTIQREATDEG